MQGIEKLSKVFTGVIKLGMALEDKLNDGKLTWIERLELIKELKFVPDAIVNYREIINEFKDLDFDEIEELNDLIATELDLDNDKVEEVIENSLEVLTTLSKLTQSLK